MRKDVLCKVLRRRYNEKKKLLESKKKAKTARQVGSVELSQEAFMSVLKLDE